MPSKKAQAASIVGEYDVELMTAPELTAYVEALLEEQGRLRKTRNLWLRDRNEVLNFLTCLRDGIVRGKQEGFQRDLEAQVLSVEQDQESKSLDELNRSKELEHAGGALRDRLDAFVRLKMAQVANREEENDLERQLADKEREMQGLQYALEVLETEMDESRLAKLMEMNTVAMPKVQSRMVQFSKSFREALDSFSQSKIATLMTVLKGSRKTETEEDDFAAFVERMGDYYKSVYWKNLKAIKDHLNQMENLKAELKELNVNLRDVLKANKELESCLPELLSPCASRIEADPGSVPRKKSTEDKLVDMSYENYVLSIKLGLLDKEFDELKARFSAARREIYQKADFKALLLEKRLKALRDAQ